MADKGKGILRRIAFVLDRPSAKKVGDQMEDVLGTAGKEGGQNFARELREAFNKRMAQLKEQLAEGLIDEKKFKQEADKAARAFNTSMLRSIQKAREEGKLTDREYIKLTRTLKRVGDQGQKSAGLLTRGFAKAITVIGGALAIRQLGRWTADLVALGVNADEAGAKFEATFEGATARMDEFVDSFGALAGLSKSEARDFTATTGAMARGMGYTTEAAADLAQEVARVAGDLTAFNNIPIAETSRAVRSALTGERESLKTLGIVIQQADVDQRAMVMSGKANAAALTQQEKAAATLALIVERMGPAAGALARESDSLAGAGRRVAAQFRTFKENLGTALVEAESGPSVLDQLSTKLEELNQWVVTNKDDIAAFASDMLDLATAFAKAAEAATRFIGAVTSPKKAWDDFWERRKFLRMREGFDPSALTEPERTAPTHNMLGQPINPATGKPTGPPDTPPTTGGVPRGPGGVAVQDPFTVDEFGRRTGVGSGLMPGEGSPVMPKGGAMDELRRRQQEQARAGSVIGRQVTGLPGLDPAATATAAEEAAAAFEGPWMGALDRIAGEVEGNGSLFADLGRAWAEGGLAGLAAFAAGKVKENLASAIEWAAKAVGFLAFGRPDQAAAAGKAAAGHAAAASAWKIAAAGLGGAGGGSRSLGAGSGVGTVASASASRAEQADPQAPETHIYIDPLDPSRPAVQKTVYAANQFATERFGREAKVFVHPRTEN